MVRTRVVLSESEIRTRKTPICLSPEPLEICVQIFDLLSDASSAAPEVCHFGWGFEQPRVGGDCKGGGDPPPLPVCRAEPATSSIIRVADSMHTLFHNASFKKTAHLRK